MKEIIVTFIDLIPENATSEIIILFLIIASFLYALSQAHIIYDFVNRFSKRELTNLKELLADENISEKAKIALREKINLIAYQKTTGIKTNDIYLQEQIIDYYRLSKGRLRYSDFRRAFALLKIDDNDILIIRNPNIFERIAHIYWTISSIFFFCVIVSLTIILLYSYRISILQQILVALSIEQISIFLLIICFSIILFFFLYQASLIPTGKRIKNELRKNKLIVKKNLKKIELRQIQLSKEKFNIPHDFKEKIMEEVSLLPFHPLAHFSIKERQKRIEQVLGAWQDDTEIDAIFAEIDRDRHNYRGRQINSFDD